MKHILGLLILILSQTSLADCKWSDPEPILNERKLYFQECKEEKLIKIGAIIVKPNIKFEIIHKQWPEGNVIWSRHSPNKKIAFVWIKNYDSERNAWVINLESNKVVMFTDHVEGKHYFPKFISNEKFIIVHAGMGYRTDYTYEYVLGVWVNTGKEEIDVKW